MWYHKIFYWWHPPSISPSLMLITQNITGKNRKCLVCSMTLWKVGKKTRASSQERDAYATEQWRVGRVVEGWVLLWILCPWLQKVTLCRQWYCLLFRYLAFNNHLWCSTLDSTAMTHKNTTQVEGVVKKQNILGR